MKDTKVSARYAKSLLELALEHGSLEEVRTDMELIAGTVKGSRELNVFLKSPVITSDKKASVIREVFGQKLSKLTSTFTDILASKHRESLLGHIAEAFLTQYKTHQNIVTATVTTAVPLSNDMREKISGIVKSRTGLTVELHEKVDKDIIGGFILQIEDQQIDSSIAGKLEELKSEFSKNPYVKEF